MIQKKFGDNQIEYRAEAGDEVVAVASSVYKSEPRAGVNKETGKAFITTTFGLTVNWKGKEIFLKLTEGQSKVLDKVVDLAGKTIIFESYDSKKGYGKLIGARVKK